MAELATSGNSGRRRGSSRMPAPRIDLTAMVDLAFLLITFFIMTTTLAKPKAMDLAMPVKGTPGAVSELSTMSVCLGKDNKVMWYMGMPEKPRTVPQIVDFSKTGLRAALIAKSREVMETLHKPIYVILKPSNQSVYSNFVAALDEFNIASIQSYTVSDITARDVDMLKQRRAF
jgi:biopolymer transport protein ExbD